MKKVLKCKQHPKYKAILQPQCACETCWKIWKQAWLERMRKRREERGH